MNHSIISFLDFNPAEVSILKIEIIDNVKVVHLMKPLAPVLCPHCNSRIHSKGQYIRSVNHPILQDGFQVTLKLHQRRWICPNPSCRFISNDEFSFVQKIIVTRILPSSVSSVI